jgi:archaellum biogenesis ATPase FlaH
MLGMTTTSDPGTTGVRDIADALGGGIRENSLIIIEGESKTGKSVLSQHIAYGVLHSKGSAVAYYSSDYNSEMLIAQMDSMSLGTWHDLVTDRLRIYKIGSSKVLRNPEKSLKLIIDHIMALPMRFKLIIVDSPSPLMTQISPMAKIDFLQTCKELCDQDRSIALTLDSHIFEKKTQLRAYAMSDYYLQLKSQNVMLEKGQIDTRVIKSLEVTKLGGVERWGQERIKFEIKPRIGIQILPFVQIRV